MNRLHALIVAMAALILGLAIALACTLGRQAPAPAPATAAAAPPPARAAAPTRPAAADADAALRQWLVGGWAEVSTNCETDTGVYYDGRGRYGAAEEEGRWRIEGGRLTVTVSHESVGDPMLGEMRALPSPRVEVMGLIRDGPDRMTLVIEDRSYAMMRCPEAQHSFST